MSSSFRVNVGSVWALALALLAGCGGGGGDSTYTVRVSPSPLQISWQDAFTEVAPVTVTAVFDAIPSGTVYPVILADAPNFETGSMVVRQVSGTTYALDITPKASLPAGVHTGNLSLKLCKDAQCASAYKLEGGTLPYELTVVPSLSVTIKLNGVSLLNASGGPLTARADESLTIDMNAGDTVELSSHAEVDWVTDVNGQPNTITVLSSSPTSWRGVLSGPPNATTALVVAAIPKDGNQRSAQFGFYLH